MPEPVNDRLYDELLRPVAEWFYETAKSLARLPLGEQYRTERAFKLGRIEALEQIGDRTAEVLGVAFPEWEAMRDLALSSTKGGAS